jgi:hypothetical protein
LYYVYGLTYKWVLKMVKGLRFKFAGITIPDEKKDMVLALVQTRMPEVRRIFVTETAVYVGTDAEHRPSRTVPKLRVRNGKMTSGLGTRVIDPDKVLKDGIGYHLRDAIQSLDAV